MTSLDLETLLLLTLEIEVVLGLLLLFVWLQNLGMRAVPWWGFAHLTRALSIALYGMFGSVSNLIAIDLANALLFTSYALTWNGARVFGGRDPRWGSLLVAPMLWALASMFPGFSTAPHLQAMLSAGISGSVIWLTAYEFWRGREERLVSRWPAIFILFLHGCAFLLRTPINLFLDASGESDAFASAWLTVVSTEALLASVSLALVLVAMTKERMELSYRTMALHDPLTGLGNRRAFLKQAAQLIELQIGRDRPVAVFMIDLDRFKSINDQFGHPTGDQVLQIFAQTAKTNLRSSDLVARLGGEEFAVLLEDASRDNAFRVADRIRRAFAKAGSHVSGLSVNATISIGVAIIQDPQDNVTTLLAQADTALYRAKQLGGNRVMIADLDAAEIEAVRQRSKAAA